MHEWLSGGVSPCQGEGRGFESRLVLRTRALSVMTKPFLHYRKAISCNVKKAPRECGKGTFVVRYAINFESI